jgi:hypothetical protein
MGQLVVSDNAASTLASSITNSPSVTSITVADGSKFPIVNHGGTGTDWSYATLYDASNNLEIVKVTRHDNGSSTLTIVRGTAAGISGVTDSDCKVWASTTTGVACRLIAKVVNDISAAAASAASDASAAAASAAAASAGIKVTAADTTAGKLDAKIAVSGLLTKAVTNPGGNEVLTLSVDAPVVSVFGRIGDVTLTEADVVAALGFTPYKNIPLSATTSGTLGVGDVGKAIAANGGITVPNNIFSGGDVVTIYNDTASAITITQGASLTLRMAATTTTGNRSLAPYGIAMLWFRSPSVAVISGSGVS